MSTESTDGAEDTPSEAEGTKAQSKAPGKPLGEWTIEELLSDIKDRKSKGYLFARAKELGAPAEVLRVLQVRRALIHESDRGAALLGAALLDEALEELLRAVFIDDEKACDLLLEDSAALGTFSSRIMLCTCLGLISTDMARNLHLMRKIRNDFAHQVDATFDSDPIASRCRELLPVRGQQAPRDSFVTNVMAMAAFLHARRYQSSHAQRAPLIKPRVDETAQFVKAFDDAAVAAASTYDDVEPK